MAVGRMATYRIDTCCHYLFLFIWLGYLECWTINDAGKLWFFEPVLQPYSLQFLMPYCIINWYCWLSLSSFSISFNSTISGWLGSSLVIALGLRSKGLILEWSVPLSNETSEQLVCIPVLLSPSGIIWYRPRGGDALWLRGNLRYALPVRDCNLDFEKPGAWVNPETLVLAVCKICGFRVCVFAQKRYV